MVTVLGGGVKGILNSGWAIINRTTKYHGPRPVLLKSDGDEGDERGPAEGLCDEAGQS